MRETIPSVSRLTSHNSITRLNGKTQ